MRSDYVRRADFVPLSRRSFLRVGGLGILGLGLPQFLQASGYGTTKQALGPVKSCIFVNMAGGPSHVDLFDLKPQAPPEIRGPYLPIATSAPGMFLGELLPQLARQGHHLCLLRSLTSPMIDHAKATQDLWAGKAQSMPNHPGFGSVMAKLRPSPDMPSYVWLNQLLLADASNSHRYGGYLRTAYAPLEIGSPNDHPALPTFRFNGFDPPANIPLARSLQRQLLLGRLDPTLTAGAPAAMRLLQEKAIDLTTGPKARAAFRLDREPSKVRDRYGREALGQNLLLARRLIESGVRLVAVNAAPSDERGGKVATTPWDMHSVAARVSIFSTEPEGLGWVAPRFDNAVAALLEDLAARSLLASTLVVIMGEFGRTPRIARNTAGLVGREHWSSCYSAILAGAGVRGGAVYGNSDRSGSYVKDRPVTLENLGATIFHALGVDPESHLTGADVMVRPVNTGQPIMEVFA